MYVIFEQAKFDQFVIYGVIHYTGWIMYPSCIVNDTIYYKLIEFDLFKYNIHMLYGYQPWF